MSNLIFLLLVIALFTFGRWVNKVTPSPFQAFMDIRS